MTSKESIDRYGYVACDTYEEAVECVRNLVEYYKINLESYNIVKAYGEYIITLAHGDSEAFICECKDLIEMPKDTYVVINDCYGGPSLSDEAIKLYNKYNDGPDVLAMHQIKEDDPVLVRVIRELGEKANGEGAKLKIVHVPSNLHWEIEGYDGWQEVVTKEIR